MKTKRPLPAPALCYLFPDADGSAPILSNQPPVAPEPVAVTRLFLTHRPAVTLHPPEVGCLRLYHRVMHLHLGVFLSKRAGATGSLARHPRRTFSATRAHHAANHYDTLSVPRNASRSQIKSAYYRLSKQFHPDINDDPQAREKFLTFSEAYTVLGDDRNRRLYDRSLAASGDRSSHHHHYQPPPPYSHYATANETRRRTANYAWERRHRPPAGSNPHAHHRHHYPHSHPSTSSDPHVRRTAADSTLYYRSPRTGWKEAELDRVNRVSGLGRAVQLVGLFIAVAVVGTLGRS
ncbi:hypothetical protein BC827DRAFT_1170053 [Russula dissimulans]|nr:hypothetical protein BC827DRAFT_1170053 [Russula dissimulans]